MLSLRRRACRSALILTTVLALPAPRPALGAPPADAARPVELPAPTPAATAAPQRGALLEEEPDGVIYRAFLTLPTSSELHRARHLGAPVSSPGVHAVELPRRQLAALRRAGVEVRVVGGTSRRTPAPELRPAHPTRAASARLPADTAAQRGTARLGGGLAARPVADGGVGVGWGFAAPAVPAGAEVTAVRYRLRIAPDGDPWCGDYAVWLFSGAPAFEHSVYDHLGGATDGGYDDDPEDDGDVELGWRRTSYFAGEDPRQEWGVLVHDGGGAGGGGRLEGVELEVEWVVAAAADAYEPDDAPGEAWEHALNDTTAGRSIDPVGDEDWITFTLGALSEVVVETAGPSGDTRMWLYDAGLTQLAFDDDGGDGFFSRIERSGASALPAGTYYAKVDEFLGDAVIADYALTLSATPLTLPDLTAPTWRSRTATVAEGESFWVEVDVTDEGAAAAASHVELYLSVDGDLDLGDDLQVPPEETVAALDHNETQTVRWTFTFPNLMDGSSSYPVWVVAVVDSRDEVAESDEGNVFRSTGTVTAWDPVDLDAVDVYFRDLAGTPLDGDEVVEGQRLSAGLELFLDAASPVTGELFRIELDGAELCSFSGTLDPGPTADGCPDDWIATVGSHSLRARLDPGGAVPESDEGNNVVERTYDVLPLEPDVRIEPLSLDFTEPAPAAVAAPAPTPTLAATPAAGAAERWRRLAARAQQEGGVRILARLATSFAPEGRLGAAAAAEQRRRIAALRQRVLERLAGLRARETGRLSTVPFLALEVDGHALEVLRRLPFVADVAQDVPLPPSLASSVPVIGGDAAWAAGATGDGWTVAVLDTGVDAAHPFFAGGKVVSEACYSSNTFESTSFCPGGVESSTAPGSGAPCPAAVDSCEHGTHVAGIAAGDDGVGPDVGVGRDAGLIAVQVFSRFDDSSDCFPLPTPCALAFVSDVTEGLERVYALRDTFDLAAANLSLGGGRFEDPLICDNDFAAMKAVIDNLRSVDVATVAAAGNGGDRNGLSTPGCISSAVSVGATEDDDDVAFFSNVASFLDLVAPGVGIVSSVPGGGTASFSGTSMSTPHVAGAWAVVRQVAPAASVDEVLQLLRVTATPVADQRGGGVETDLRRINLDQAVAAARGTGFTVHNDGTGPLQVLSIAPDQEAPWITWTPRAPFALPAGGERLVVVRAHYAVAPPGTSQRRLLVSSDDPDESPYPGGVFVSVTPQVGCVALDLSAQTVITEESFESCDVLSAGDGFAVQAPGRVTFTSGTRVVLRDGFSVGSGAVFAAGVDPALREP